MCFENYIKVDYYVNINKKFSWTNVTAIILKLVWKMRVQSNSHWNWSSWPQKQFQVSEVCEFDRDGEKLLIIEFHNLHNSIPCFSREPFNIQS